MNKKKQTYSIRGKLVSATCMLLVAVIMVVSSTYAWFTLSTAPEVTGIHTAIGANGALEMALNTGLAGGPLSGTLPSGATTEVKNTYWGNLVDLEGDTYGLNQITLLPSKFNAENGEFGNAGFLSTPEYGSDGRVSSLVQKAVLGKYDGTAFYPIADTNYLTDLGVRGVGSASGMSERELAYRNAGAKAITLMGQAKSAASVSLETNGAVLANVAVKHGTAAAGSDTYSKADIGSMIAVCDDLLGPGTKVGVLEAIEQAYLQYILMYAASNDGPTEDTAWMAVKAAISADDATIDSALAALGVEVTTLPEALQTAFSALKTTKANVVAAKTTLTEAEADDGSTYETATDTSKFAWASFSTGLSKLVDTDGILVNEKTVAWIKENQNDFIKLAANGITVTMATGGGVYADVADHCGDYKASILLDITYGSLEFTDFPANMNTKTTVKPEYLTLVNTAISAIGAYKGAASTAKPLTEFYGYIIDLSFRTNAVGSSLLLQTTPTDRIYKDNTNANTQGGGSSMTFTTNSTSFTPTQMKALMSNIRIVFFVPGATNQILCEARLDATNATTSTDGNGLTANMYLLDEKGLVTTQADAKIVDLAQNTEQKVSVLVYLDGENLQNADVAADVAASMSGTMNLQFSSSANLVPMEYADLHQKGETTTTAAPSNP